MAGAFFPWAFVGGIIMSAPDALVHTELDGSTYLVGHLWIRETRRGTFGASFQYADAWLAKKDAFAVDPLLPLVSPGPFHKERLFGRRI